jgi:hypothetical protein
LINSTLDDGLGRRTSVRRPFSGLRITLIALCLSFTGLVTTSTAMADLEACRRIENGAERLACYDQLPNAGNTTPDELFGLDSRTSEQRLQRELGISAPTSLESTVTEVGRTADGKLRLTLANGQLWLQVDTTPMKVISGDLVEIRPAALGSYLLRTRTSIRGIRVRRIATETSAD